MSATLQSLGIDRMSVDERLALVEAIWDTLASKPDDLPLTVAQRIELDRRLAAHAKDPSQVVAWETVRDEAVARFRK